MKSDELCGSCWGSGWAEQFVVPCDKCNGTGKKTIVVENKEVSKNPPQTDDKNKLCSLCIADDCSECDFDKNQFKSKMTITDKKYIEFVVESAGLEYGSYNFLIVDLDYNILMTAVENINADKKYYILKGLYNWKVGNYKDGDIAPKLFDKEKYNNSMLLALQHALLSIMDNEK